MNLEKSLNDISKIGLFVNITIFVITFFYNPLWIFITILIINIVLFGTLYIIKKNYLMFAAMAATNNLFKNLNNKLENIHNKNG